MTTVSILIPHYNDPDGLALSLRSIESQTWRGAREIVVVDDGSRPEHQARLDEVIATSPERIRLVRNGVNRGRPWTRNVLLDNADGKYLTWLDAGDEYYPRKLELQLEGLYAARAAGATGPIWATAHSDLRWVGGQRKLRRVVQRVDGDQLANLLLDSLRAYLYTLLGRTETFRDVGYFDLKLPRLQDLDFFLRFIERGGRLVLPPGDESLCVYHKTDVGRNGDEVLRCNQYLFRKHAAWLMTRSRRFRRNRQFHQHMLAARFTNNNDDRVATLRHLAASASTSPWAFGRWIVKTRGRL
ncbi:MAG: glycosyltransferase family 2 protein [Kofleriaceae bacterium]